MGSIASLANRLTRLERKAGIAPIETEPLFICPVLMSGVIAWDKVWIVRGDSKRAQRPTAEELETLKREESNGQHHIDRNETPQT